MISNVVRSIDKILQIRLIASDASMDGEDSINMRLRIFEDIPMCLSFCLRFLGLWAGNDAYRNGRPVTDSKRTGNENMIELQEFTSDFNEAQPLLTDSSNLSSRAKGKDYILTTIVKKVPQLTTSLTAFPLQTLVLRWLPNN